MPNQFEPFGVKVRANILAEKLLERSEQELERPPLGFAIVDNQDTPKAGCGIFVGLLLLGLGIYFGIRASNFIALLTEFINTGFSTTNIIPLVNSAFFVVLTFEMVFFGIKAIMPASGQKYLQQLDNGELTFPCYPWRLGETVTITFRRNFKPGYKTKTTGKLLGRLICLEVYADNRGSGSPSYYGEPVWFEDLPSLDIPADTSKIEIDWLIRIPKNGVPSIKKIDHSNQTNAVFWGIDVCLDFPNLIRDDSVFYLLVEPEVI